MPLPRTENCPAIGMPYIKQLRAKHRAMEELFAPPIERFGWDARIAPVEGMGGTSDAQGRLPAPRGFRHKASTPFAPTAAGGVASGFFARGTHRIVPCERCAIETPGAREILNGITRIADELGIPAYDEDARRGILRYAQVRLGWKRPEAMVTIVAARADVPHLDELARRVMALDGRIRCVALNVNGRPGNAILGPRTQVVSGAPCMRDELLNCVFEISPTAFYQTNPAQTEVLYRLAIEGAAARADDVVLDTYCGSGTIGLALARAAADAGSPVRLIGVERNPAGVADARRNAGLNGIGLAGEAGGAASDRGADQRSSEASPTPAGDSAAVHASPAALIDAIAPGQAAFVAQDATDFMRRAAREGAHVDVLVMDPPRAGSTLEFLDAASALAPRRIVYISCNPATQARDLEQLGRAGWRLVSLVPVDMFPHTEHVETVAVLTR